jgi:phosphatidate cytidylyltransferase
VLGRRLISASVIISVMIGLVTLDHWLGRDEVWQRPGWILATITLVFLGLAAAELAAMWRSHLRDVSARVSVIGTLAMGTISLLPIYLPQSWWVEQCGLFGGWGFGLFAALIICLSWAMIRYGQHADPVAVVGYHLFIVVYLSLICAMVPAHRLLLGDNSAGMVAVLYALVTIKLSDAMAYAVGKTIGRHAMSPRLSPKKTIEGAIGSLLGGILGAFIVWGLVAPPLCGDTFSPPWPWVIIYGGLVAVAGIWGDLAESLIKREAGCKDSSVWLPGLGGVLDIMDSMVFAVPVSWLLLKWGTAW